MHRPRRWSLCAVSVLHLRSTAKEIRRSNAALVPTWRGDVTQPADVVEEVARIIGYESLPESLPPAKRHRSNAIPSTSCNGRAVALAAVGGWETVTYVTISEDDLRRLDPDAERSSGIHPVDLEPVLRLRNPLQADRDILRPTLMPSLLETLAAEI